jgi:streptomycin 6-kinase
MDCAGSKAPEGLAWLNEFEAGRQWLADLPGRVRSCAERWGLRLGDPFEYAFVSAAFPGVTTDGAQVVLKVQFPHRESEHEAAALAHWGGDGAVGLCEHDPAIHALLIERCLPGWPLSEVERDAALDVFAGLLRRLWNPASTPFITLANEAARWAIDLPASWERAGRPFEPSLLDTTLEVLHTLPGTQGEQVLVNQDLHAGNVLRATRQPWLVIDPKPLVGEREFSVAPIVRDDEPKQALYRLDYLCGRLQLNRERALKWTIAQTLAWSFEGDTVIDHHVDVARHLLAAA